MERIPEGEAIGESGDARRYNEHMGSGFMRRRYRETAEKVVNIGVPDGGTVVDVGTGPGFVALELADMLRGRAKVVGLDLSTAMLTVATENAQVRGLSDYVSWREAGAQAMPFEDSTVDFVVSSGSLHHWEDPVRVFDEMERVLKANGQLLVEDLRRDLSGLSYLFSRGIALMIPKDFRVHYYGSIQASYTADELRALLGRSRLTAWEVRAEFMGLSVTRRATDQSDTAQDRFDNSHGT